MQNTLNKKEFASIRAELARNEKNRELLIRDSRDIIRMSKHAIYAIHRNDMKKASGIIAKMKPMVKKLPSNDFSTGMKKVALQEYVEAVSLMGFVKSGKIPSRSALGAGTEGYLGGLSDLTGELVRMAVNRAIREEFSDVIKIKDAVDEIYGEFLQLDLRNSELRKKSDQIKWNLQKIEDVAYNISLKKSRKK